MTYRSRPRREQLDPARLLVIMCGYVTIVMSLLIVASVAYQWLRTYQQPELVMIAGAEDDCPTIYGQRRIVEVVGVEVDGQPGVECRY